MPRRSSRRTEGVRRDRGSAEVVRDDRDRGVRDPADRLCEELDGTHFDAFVNRCRARGDGEYEIQQILDGVKRVLRWLVERRLIKHSYVETYRFTSVGIKDLNADQEYTYDEAQHLQFPRGQQAHSG